MDKKVYCEICRWHDCGNFEYPSDDCNKITGYKFTYQAKNIPVRTDGLPSELNANNDCAYYSWNWFGLRGF